MVAMDRLLAGILGLVMLSAPGCGASFGPGEIVSDSVRVVARASPDEIAPGDSLQIVAVYHNQLDRPLSLGFSMGCPFYLEVAQRTWGGRIPMDGSAYGCTANLSGLTVPAGDSAVSRVWLVASVRGDPVLPGSYVARLDFTNATWNLEAPFLVK